MMHIENLHEMIEDLTSCTKDAMKNNKSNVGNYPISMVTDMIKDLAEAEYYSTIVKAMHEADKEQEEEDKYMLKRMKEEYGEDEGQRYYNDYRYASGRFAPRGKGTKRNYTMYPAEYYRDADIIDGKMYYSEMNGMESHEMNGAKRYNDGYHDGESMGYKRGYEEGKRTMPRDYREGRSGRNRRTYIETKETKDNSPESKQMKMRELEKYMNELSSDITEMIGDASPEEKNLLKNKLQTLSQKF